MKIEQNLVLGLVVLLLKLARTREISSWNLNTQRTTRSGPIILRRYQINPRTIRKLCMCGPQDLEISTRIRQFWPKVSKNWL